MLPTPRYHFGPFTLDPSECRLTRDGEPVPLSPRLLAVLKALVERAGHLVTKEELIAVAWGEAVVEENALPVAVSRLRTVLGREPVYIETAVGHGYRFVAPVRLTPPPPPPGVTAAAPELDAPPAAHPLPPRPVQLAVLLAVALALAVAVGAGGSQPPSDPEPAPSAVLATETREPSPPNGSPWAAAEAVAQGNAFFATRRHWVEALHAFRQAATLDSSYAPAYLGMANVYVLGHGTAAEVQSALDRALALDPALGEAYATLGFARAFQQWDWPGAEAAFRQALALAPDHPRTHQWHAAYLLVHRRFAEAEAAVGRALALDPGSPNLHSDLCEVRLARRDFAGARAACERALALDPDLLFARQHVFWLNLLERSPADAVRWSALTRTYQRPRVPAGSDPDAFLTAIAEDLTITAPMVPFDAYHLARVEAARGNAQASIGALALAVRQREFHVPFANADPVFDGLRAEPRFRALMRGVGLGD